MAGKIIIDTERCKGCGLCIIVCPNKSIVISKQSNKNGYFPAQPVLSGACPERSRGVEGSKNADCTGCAMCAVVCPDAVIEVYRDEPDKIEIVVEPAKKGKKRWVKEK